jgi:hypothetical protein
VCDARRPASAARQDAMLEWLLPRVLIVLGAGFLLANLRIVLQMLRFLRLRSSALLTWPGRKPPAYGMFLALGVILGLVIMFVVLHQRFIDFFGESMMFLYYGYLVPLSLKIGRGFYRDGVWLEDGFMPYGNIGGLSWREEGEITLLLIPRMKRLARRLIVPKPYYGQARRLLRDKIKGHDIHFTGKALDLGDHDEADDV